jgi:hypothetical protein
VVDSRSQWDPFSQWWFYMVYVRDQIVALCETG